MDKIFEKISSYNIFNHIIPGGILFSFASYLFPEISIDNDVFTLLIFYYFTGMIISRIGSLVIESILLKINFVEYAPYEDFIAASRVDEKIETLVEVNNTYRTFSSMFFFMLIIYIAYIFKEKIYKYIDIIGIIIFILFFICFIFSYKKQTAYIKSRIEKQKQQ